MADILAGSLEYAWSGPAPELSAPEFSASTAPYRNHLKTLRATFEQSMGRFQTSSINMLSTLDADQKSLDCKALQPKLYEQLDLVSQALSTIETDYPSLQGTVAPLRKLFLEPLAKQVDVGGLGYLKRTQMGLIGFMNLYQFFTTDTARVMDGIINSAGQLLKEIQEVISCTDRSSLVNFIASQTESVDPSCAAVQGIYDDYQAQVKAMINDGKANVIKKESLDAALASLQFQSAGAYLSDQNATDAITAMGESDLSALMKLVQGAGDTLQACQQSIHSRAVHQEALQDNVSSLEQTVYSHLALNIRRVDPVVRSRVENNAVSSESLDRGVQSYPNCEHEFSAAVAATQEIMHNIGTFSRNQNAAANVAQAIMAGYVKRVERRLRKPISDVMTELQQLEIAIALLVRNTKSMPEDNVYTLVKQLTDDLQQLESKIHILLECMQLNPQDKPASENIDGGYATVQGMGLKCDILAEVFKGTLAQISRELEKAEKADVDKEAIALFRSRIQLLVIASDLWDMNLADYQPRKGLVYTDAAGVLQDQSFTATLLQAKGLEEMVKLIPLVIAQANSLEACTNVQEATSGDQDNEEDSEYDPDDSDSVEPGWDEDNVEHWANGQGGYSVYVGVPSVEQLASEFEYDLRSKGKEKTSDAFAVPNTFSDISGPNLKYDCTAIMGEMGEGMSLIDEQLSVVAKEAPQLVPMMEQVVASSRKMQDELALHPRYAKYYMRSLSIIFRTVERTLETIPRNDNLEVASEFFSDLVDVALTARNCLQIKPENQSAVPEESASEENEEEEEEEERVERAMCSALGEILGATTQAAIHQWSEFARAGFSDGRLQQTVQQGLGLLQKLDKAVITRKVASVLSASWSDKSIADAVAALVLPGSYERVSHSEFRVLQDAFEQTMLQGRALVACMGVAEWE
ncbi:hypothetical protein BG000_009350 [Podila horticola]|nr:hypothetical protein BG000_009350 [Podila horticola]